MKWMPFSCATAIAIALATGPNAAAQSFLQRLGEQFQQAITPLQNPPAQTEAQPARAEDPSTRAEDPPARAEDPPTRAETLPPPRGTTPRDGSRAALGLRVGPVTDEVIREQRLAVRRGAVITGIEQGSAADRAGLPLGGVIVAVDGRRIDQPADLIQAIQASKVGQDVELTYYDGAQLARKKVHVAALPPAALVEDPIAAERPGRVPAARSVPEPTADPETTVRTYRSGLNLEQDLGAGGARPWLGRLGRVIDNVTAPLPIYTREPVPRERTVREIPAEPAVPNVAEVPAAAEEPIATDSVSLTSIVAELQQRVNDLSREVVTLRKRVAALEAKPSDNE